jgi:hypothetical protein
MAAVRQYTAKDRLARSVKRINEWCRRMRHWPLWEQQLKLRRMLQGHYAYFGISSNIDRLKAVHRAAYHLWRKWLNRRTRRPHLAWERFLRLLERFPLPAPRIIHRYT